MNNAIALIPARYKSSRFPGKLMQILGGETVILRTYHATVATGLFSKVVVVTDSAEIYEEIVSHGGQAMRSRKEHACGSDRIAEAAADFPEADIIVNVQGDEPFTAREPLEALLKVFEGPDAESIDLASIMCPITDPKAIDDPNLVKVITSACGNAMYFSRSRIPYNRDDAAAKYFQHIGVYAFRRQALMDFAATAMGPLEAAEKLEGLRFLESGKCIRMIQVAYSGVGIDTPEDLKAARELVSAQSR